MTDDVLGDGARLLDAMNRAEFERAKAKITTAPLDLAARDFELLETYGGEPLLTKAYEARRLAQLEVVRQCGGSHSNTSPNRVRPAQQAKGIETPDDTLTWKEYVAKHGHKKITLAVTDALINVYQKQLDEMNERNKERNARLDALENRVLELEASIAAVSHVEPR